MENKNLSHKCPYGRGVCGKPMDNGVIFYCSSCLKQQHPPLTGVRKENQKKFYVRVANYCRVKK